MVAESDEGLGEGCEVAEELPGVDILVSETKSHQKREYTHEVLV